MESSMASVFKNKKHILWPSNSTSGYLSKIIQIINLKKIYALLSLLKNYLQ